MSVTMHTYLKCVRFRDIDSTTRLHDSEEQARSLRVRVSRQQDELEERAIVIEQFLADGDRPKKLIPANLATLAHQYQKLEESNINLTNQLVYEKKLSQGLMCFLDTHLRGKTNKLICYLISFFGF